MALEPVTKWQSGFTSLWWSKSEICSEKGQDHLGNISFAGNVRLLPYTVSFELAIKMNLVCFGCTGF